MSRSIEELQRAITEEIEILVELDPLIGSRRQVVIENEGPTPIGVGPVGVLHFALARDEGRVGKVSQAARMIEMRMRQDDVLDVRRFVADALDLLVERVLL